MTILITGAFGFIGNNLSKHLKSSNKFHLIALDTHKQSHNYYDESYLWEDFDMIDWNNIDSIIHLAGIAHDTNKRISDDNYFRINVELTKTVFNRFLQSKASKFMFFSSVKAVADTVIGNELTENSEPEPRTAYGISKHLAEKYITEHQAEYDKNLEPKHIYILRPCMIHGPGNKGNLNSLYDLVRKGVPWPLGAFENSRSYVSIMNLQYIIEELILNNIDSGVYNIADDKPLSTNEIVRIISDETGKKLKILKINRHFIVKFSKMGDWLKLPLNSEVLKKLTESYVVSNSKIKTALGINNLPITSEKGLRETLRSFINSRN